MSPERARQVANGILTVAGVALAVVVWRQPALRRLARHFVPIALREIRPVHVAAALAALAGPAATAAAVAATDGSEPAERGASEFARSGDRAGSLVGRSAGPPRGAGQNRQQD